MQIENTVGVSSHLLILEQMILNLLETVVFKTIHKIGISIIIPSPGPQLLWIKNFLGHIKFKIWLIHQHNIADLLWPSTENHWSKNY